MVSMVVIVLMQGLISMLEKTSVGLEVNIEIRRC
jgi:hypothetical protein